MRRSYRLAIKLLIMLALPMATLFTLLAAPLVGFLSGTAFLPHGAIALQILVWSIIFGWINSLTNYALMALDRQRQVMLASAARVIFAVVMNLLLVRQFSYIASAGIIISGELLLMILFYTDLRRQLGPVGWGKLLWRVALAALITVLIHVETDERFASDGWLVLLHQQATGAGRGRPMNAARRVARLVVTHPHHPGRIFEQVSARRQRD